MKPGRRLDRQKALQKMQEGQHLTPYDIELIEAMPTQRKTLAAHLEKQRAGQLTEAAPDDTPAAAAPVSSKPLMLTGDFGQDSSVFAQWIGNQPEDIRRLLSREVEEPPHAKFSHKTIQKMAMSGASDKEIATLLNVDRKEMIAEAKHALEYGRTVYRFLLHQRQFGAAMAGDRTMLVWLGKQKLGQMDRMATEHSGPGGQPIEVMEGVRKTRAKLDRLLSGADIATIMATGSEEAA